MKTYTTDSGTYTEDVLAVVIWLNPKKDIKSRARRLETLTAEGSSLPMAFPIDSMYRGRAWSNAFFASNPDEVYYYLAKSDRSKPVVVSLPIARESLGWSEFFIPTEYVEKP